MEPLDLRQSMSDKSDALRAEVREVNAVIKEMGLPGLTDTQSLGETGLVFGSLKQAIK